jgi:hypothetical protein
LLFGADHGLANAFLVLGHLIYSTGGMIPVFPAQLLPARFELVCERQRGDRSQTAEEGKQYESKIA